MSDARRVADGDGWPRVDLPSAINSKAIRAPTVSVVVTNYNYEDYIEDCLGSIADQTTIPTECIIVDDASSDGSVRRIREFIASQSGSLRFSLVELEKNAGQMNGFVEGFQRTSGEFVVFVDADDFLFPDFIETHLAAHLNTDYLAALTSSNEVLVDGTGRVLAGSIEKMRRTDKARPSPTSEITSEVVTIAQWRETWSFGDSTGFHQTPKPLLYVSAKGNVNREFIWTTTSGTMFRRGALEFVLTERSRDVSISADFYLFHYCHLLGGSTLIQTNHGFYRRHGFNNFSTTAVIGRGARTWSGPQAWSRADLFRKLEDDILQDIDRLRILLGTPRMLQVLTLFLPLRRMGDVVYALRSKPPEIAGYAALLAIVSLKKLARALRRVWEFA